MTIFVRSDIGGTFTDLVGYDSEREEVSFGKTLTTPRNLVDGVMAGIHDVKVT